MNCLIDNKSQVFNDNWKNRMKVHITDTGNAMSDEEIMEFSKSVCIDELLTYRNAVGMQSRRVINGLQPGDMKRKMDTKSIAKILEEGGVIVHPDSIWLLDFWSKKDVAGIIMMPITRHMTLHLNDCYKWYEAIRTKKNFFMH